MRCTLPSTPATLSWCRNHNDPTRESDMTSLSRRQVLGGLGATVLIAGQVRAARAQDAKVVVVSWGGDYQDALREAYWKPFTAATKISVVEDTRPLPPRIKAMVE